MRLLLDTHAFIWFIEGNHKLSKSAINFIEDNDNQCFISIASLWEMSIKASLGKLKVKLPFSKLVTEHIDGNDMKILPIKPQHLDGLKELPFHHRDPFDRLIISQAQVEDMVLLSRDTEFSKYKIQCYW